MTTTGKANQIKQNIHAQLLELCAIADEQELTLDVEIKTEYLNRSGNVGANAIMDFRVDMMEK